MEETHRTVIARLSRGQRRALTERSDTVGLRHLAGHGGAIVAVGLMIVAAVPAWPALLVVQGILVVFLFTTLHEAIHRTAFRSGWLNDVVAEVCGFLLLLPPRWFRRFHFDHHRYTNDPGRDPELAAPRPTTVTEYLVYLTGIPVWRSQIRTLFVNAAGRNRDTFVNGSARRAVTVEARCHLAGYGLLAGISIAGGSDVLVWTWLVPIAVGQPFLRAYLLAEHAGCPCTTNMLENSRTTFTTRVVRWLSWNMPYHAEHHAYPSVPFHKLPEFHGYTRAHLRSTANGYRNFHRELLASVER